MSQSQKASRAASLQKHTAIDSIPEDVAAIVVKMIQSWEKGRGSHTRTEEGRRARDSTLLGLSLTSKKAKALYHCSLIENLTIDFGKTLSIYYLLCKGGADGSKVKSLLSTQPSERLSKAIEGAVLHEYFHFFDLPPFGSQKEFLAFDQAREEVLRCIYEKLNNLQVLTIEDANYGTPFYRKVDGQFIMPLYCLTNSLKVLHIGLAPVKEALKTSISARNVTWLLIFCQCLEKATLGCSVSISDFKFLAEHHQYYEGLSRVKELAVTFAFVNEPGRKTFWSLKGEENGSYGNKKTECVHRLLSISNQLLSFEIGTLPGGEDKRADDTTEVVASCLFAALHRSRHSLAHLRQFLNTKTHLSSDLDYTFFDGLVSLTLEPLGFGNCANKSRARELPNLSEVAVTKIPVNPSGEIIAAPNKLWIKHRKELEGLDIIKSGQVKLNKWLPGDVIAKGLKQNPMSNSLWMYS